MSKTVGHLSPFTGQSGEGYKGDLTLHQCRGQIALAPVSEKRKDSSPDYTVLVDREGHGRGWQEYGLAWIKSPKDKAAYLSILLNHESLPGDFNIAAFPPFNDSTDKRWVIVFGRPKGGNIARDAAREIATDAVPF
jgi:uncharacterized protein (DUF736 family)